MFEKDATAQLAVIRENLRTCPQTDALERESLSNVIESVVTEPTDLGQIARLRQSVRQRVSDEGWYFLGRQRPELSSKELLNTQSAMRFEQRYSMGLRARDATLTIAEAHGAALRMISELHDPLLFASAIDRDANVSLHAHGSPMWLANPDLVAAPVDSNLEHLPSRLGLAPHSGRYVLLTVRADVCVLPRFADSGAYPYWRPGGRTQPLDDCPDGLDGLEEVIADRLTLGSLSKPVRTYVRKS